MTGGEFENFRELLKKIPAREFDGHTEFEPLSPEQKLEWLANAVIFYFKYTNTTGQPETGKANP